MIFDLDKSTKISYQFTRAFQEFALLPGAIKALEITRLDLMAYLDPASNLRPKPQRFSAKKCKSSTSDKLQTFKTIFGISCKQLTIMRKNSCNSWG